ncbi:uncharacterized protein MYCGRDRAFT_88700 [Zymoseptoria tritici IPO323]|uniref:RING-type domain-containing protein n=1 Tax=Zymoseptoria tritici (strain CBS 115943 / IPO323) TaxID=336722 RepID=F9WXH7_ZYMTI|nr:uncharacterized protein MYCGRDRAFT_88700 [Zymoseptoria tritici IPO323]EGP92731.1 hypothetical protein MYCGRDRAFT_88700 [Zymoseptoria tritici IPO323]
MSSSMTSQVAERIFSKTKPALELAKPLVSVSGERHWVHVEHPSEELCNPDEHMAMMSPSWVAARLDPTLPLVPDAAVTARAGRENESETSMISYYECTGPFDENFWPSANNEPGRTFQETMQEVLEFPGETTIRIVNYLTADDPVARVRIRLECLPEAPALADLVCQFEMTSEEFQHADGLLFGQDRPQWCIDIEDVVYRNSDRACRHVAFQYYDPQDEREHGGNLHAGATAFGRQRHPKYSQVLQHLATAANTDQLPEDDRACIVCAEDYFIRPGHHPVVLAAVCGHDQHIVCANCVLQICEAKGPKEACCPHCRAKYFTTKPQLDFLVFGEVNGVFHADDSYTDWENFQRSCSDLDKKSAITSDTTISITNPTALFNIWLTLFSDDLKDAAEPFDKRLDFTPEFRTLVLSVESFFRYAHGVEYTAAGFRRKLLDDIHNTLLGEQLADENDAIPRRNPTLPIGASFFRPGMAQALDRSLERFFRALELRMCACGAAADECGKHEHGDRYFWCPNEVGRKREALKTWEYVDDTVAIHDELMGLERRFREDRRGRR